MKKFLFAISLVILCNTASAQFLCGDVFTDSGGSDISYSDNESYTVTIYPDNPGEMVTVSFLTFAT